MRKLGAQKAEDSESRNDSTAPGRKLAPIARSRLRLRLRRTEPRHDKYTTGCLQGIGSVILSRSRFAWPRSNLGMWVRSATPRILNFLRCCLIIDSGAQKETSEAVGNVWIYSRHLDRGECQFAPVAPRWNVRGVTPYVHDRRARLGQRRSAHAEVAAYRAGICTRPLAVFATTRKISLSVFLNTIWPIRDRDVVPEPFESDNYTRFIFIAAAAVSPRDSSNHYRRFPLRTGGSESRHHLLANAPAAK